MNALHHTEAAAFFKTLVLVSGSPPAVPVSDSAHVLPPSLSGVVGGEAPAQTADDHGNGQPLAHAK